MFAWWWSYYTYTLSALYSYSSGLLECTSGGTIIYLPQCLWSNSKAYASNKAQNVQILCIILGNYTTACTIPSKCWRMQQAWSFLIHSNFIWAIIFHNASVYTIWYIVTSVYAYYCLYCWVCVCCGGLIRYAWQWYCWTPFTVYPQKYAHGFALLCVVEVMHWLIFPYPSGLLHWHCGNLTIAPVPAKQPWWIWINTSCEFIMNDCITKAKQSTTKPCAYFLGYTVCLTARERLVATGITPVIIVEDLSGYGFSQWEATLQCNAASRCLNPYPGWSLGYSAFKWWWYKSLIGYQRLKFSLNDCNQIVYVRMITAAVKNSFRK